MEVLLRLADGLGGGVKRVWSSPSPDHEGTFEVSAGWHARGRRARWGGCVKRKAVMVVVDGRERSERHSLVLVVDDGRAGGG